ncbi:MAG: hypothetical protein WAO76_16830 [Georgfuchsia sp.]
MNQPNRQQWVVLVATLANLALVSLFPPFDYLSLLHGNIPTFSGFFWVLEPHPNHVVNTNFLALEIIVIFINAGIAWLLLGKEPALSATKMLFWRHGVLWMTGINLVVMLLFPPFENYASVSKAILPSFEGFYFVFGDNSLRQLVTPILYIEIILLLINAGLLLLFLKERKQEKLGPREIKAIAERMRAQRH